MAGRLSRFLHLERARDPREANDGQVPSDRSERFEGVEPTGTAPDAVHSAPGHLARFDQDAPPEDVYLQPRSEADQPFVRCARCEADNGRFARACVGCGASLDSPDQRAFNERLWAERRAAREEEKARLAEAARHRDAEIEASSREKRAYYEELARNVRAETEANMGGGWREARWTDLLWGIGRRRYRRSLPPGVQLVLVGGILAVFVWTGISRGSFRGTGATILILLVAVAISVARMVLRR